MLPYNLQVFDFPGLKTTLLFLVVIVLVRIHPHTIQAVRLMAFNICGFLLDQLDLDPVTLLAVLCTGTDFGWRKIQKNTPNLIKKAILNSRYLVL